MSIFTVSLDDSNFSELRRDEGHFYIQIPIIREGTKRDEYIDFILDTGAYITVISRRTAIKYKYDILPKDRVNLHGFTGNELADLVEIPALKIMDKVMTNVKVLIPVDININQEVLGLNVLEYFNYYIDTKNDKIYFKENDNPRPIIGLACGRIYIANDFNK